MILVSAQSNLENTLSFISNSLFSFTGLVNLLISFVIAFSFLFFFWYVLQYLKGGSDGVRGLENVLWGVLGLFVLVSIWGIVAFLQNILFGPNFNNNIDENLVERIRV